MKSNYLFFPLGNVEMETFSGKIWNAWNIGWWLMCVRIWGLPQNLLPIWELKNIMAPWSAASSRSSRGGVVHLLMPSHQFQVSTSMEVSSFLKVNFNFLKTSTTPPWRFVQWISWPESTRHENKPISEIKPLIAVQRNQYWSWNAVQNINDISQRCS